MEGQLGIDTGHKKGIFSLKSKKKYHCVLQGTTLTYSKEGDSTPVGTISLTTDTNVEGSPKGKRVITIKNTSGEWDLICPDPPTYSKWMDTIALAFRSLHVDESQIRKIMTSGEEGLPEDDSGSNSTSTTPRGSANTSSTVNSSTTPRTSGSETHVSSAPESRGIGKESANNSPTTDILPPRSLSIRPVVPDRPTSLNTSKLAQNEGSKSEVTSPRAPDSPKPEVPRKPERFHSASQSAVPSSALSPRSVPPPTPVVVSSGSRVAIGASGPPKPSISPPPGGAPKKLVKSGPPPVPAVKGNGGLQRAQTVESSTREFLSPRLPMVAGSVKTSTGPPVLKTYADSNGHSPTSSNNTLSTTPKVAAVGRTSPPPGSVRARLESATSVDPGKAFTVWLPNGMKHGTLVTPEMTVRSVLEKICRVREGCTPNTFVPKQTDDKVVEMDALVSKLPNNELFWDTLAPGQAMPASVTSSTPTPRDSSPSSSNPVSPTGTLRGRDYSKSEAVPMSGKLMFARSDLKEGSKDTITISAPPAKPSPTTTLPETMPDGAPIEHRTKIVREILSTEQAYVDSLRLLENHYLTPLAMPATAGATITTTTLLPPIDVINRLFPKYMKMICEFNATFCETLHTAIITNNDADTVGAIFMKYGSFLKMYNEYSSDYQSSLNAYNKAIRDYPAFGARLEELRTLSGSRLKIEDLIIMPVQRVPRYSLLLGDLLKHTPSTHSDYNNLSTALQQMDDINNFINESMRKNDNAKRMGELESKGANFQKIFTPSRFLVREGPVKVIEMKKKETKHFFLFNDILVSVKDSLLKQGVDLSLPEYWTPLNLVWINETDSVVDITGPHGVCMTIKKKKNTDMTWVRDINVRVQAHIQKIQPDQSNNTGSRRIGIYTSSSDETYDGEWLNGLKHGKGKSTFGGVIYEGSWELGKRQGTGTLTYSTGMKYIGEWKSDIPHGEGTMYNANDEPIYAGSWVNGTPHGLGTWLYYPIGDKYVGDIVEGRCTGQGSLISPSGMQYEGSWKDNQFDGQGTLLTTDHISFEGQFRAGLKHGKGLIKYPNGSSYIGEFVEGVRQGKGEFTDTDGSVYDGDWSDDKAEGRGTKTYPDSSKYDGLFVRGIRKGQGKCFYADGARYDGNWLDDLPHLSGTFIFSDSSTYVGVWSYGRREGRGTMVYSNQAKYDGFWQNDRFTKSGIYIGAPTEVIKLYDGEWVNGKMSNKGHLQFQNGDSYKGAFKDGRLHGAGTYYYSSGAYFVGKWNMGQHEGKGTYFLSPEDKGTAGFFESSANIMNTGNGLLFLPPQQPFFLAPAAIDATRLFHR